MEYSGKKYFLRESMESISTEAREKAEFWKRTR